MLISSGSLPTYGREHLKNITGLTRCIYYIQLSKNVNKKIHRRAKKRGQARKMFFGEKIHNPDFNYGGFAIIKSQTGLYSYGNSS
ncbi:MAG: hypothetical protein KAW12_11260 [Candidatus Aminicenantes bacterium]|nr:hypothetical protein [Candidatus Aminicenantes bacterium]